MRIYYQDADITVAADCIQVGSRLYALGDIDDAWRRGRRAVGRNSAAAGAMLVLVAGVEVSLGLLTRWIWAGPGLLLVAGALLVRVVAQLVASSSALQAVENLRRYGRRLELWVSVARAPVLVLRTHDAIRYGQVCRAVVRALDDHEATRPIPED